MRFFQRHELSVGINKGISRRLWLIKTYIKLLMRKPSYIVHKYANLHFYCPTKIQEQLARDIISGLNFCDLPEKQRTVEIFMGTHHFFGRCLLSKNIKIAIQTEQIYDLTGSKIQFSKSTFNEELFLQACCFSNAILDLSEGNRTIYEKYSNNLVGRTILLGPYIFPSRHRKNIKSETNGKVLFFGGIPKNSHREKVLLDLSQNDIVCIANPSLFGEELTAKVIDYDAILNIHVCDAIYTEAPRLLSAVLHSKILISEELGKPFEKGVHYIHVDRINEPFDKSVIDNLLNLSSSRFSFVSGLAHLLKNAGN